ncbi:hypothetical protein P3S67_030022 [Capsicum chacoense]
MKDLGELKYFLGIEFARSDQGILMHQRKYTLELISELGLGAAKPAITPIDTNVKLTTRAYDEYLNKNPTEDPVLSDKGAYQRLIGKLLYLTGTRPDIAYGVETLSQYLQEPKKSHMDTAMRIVRYVKNQPGQGILISSKAIQNINAYCDADWAACAHTRKSVTGFLIKLGNSLVSWKSKKQTTISRSFTEAEYRSMASTVSELVWLLSLLEELQIEVSLPVNIFSDNKSTLQIAANPVFHERTKHIEIDCHFIREKIQEEKIKAQYISTKDQPADVLTKVLLLSLDGPKTLVTEDCKALKGVAEWSMRQKLPARKNSEEYSPWAFLLPVIMVMIEKKRKSGDFQLECLRYLIAAFDEIHGGGSGDPYNFSQNKKSLLGKIMRLDVDSTPSAAEITKLGLWGNYIIPKDNPYIEDKELQPEIWALGKRNPWRCIFDSARPSYFMCADTGQACGADKKEVRAILP